MQTRPTVPPKEPPPGRNAELALLRDRVLAVKNGAKRAVFLTGPAGIGKTTLLEYLRDEIMGEMKVAWVRVPGAGQMLPFFPITDILEQLGAPADRDKVAFPLHVASSIAEAVRDRPAAIFIDDYPGLPKETSDVLFSSLRLASGFVILLASWRDEIHATTIPDSSGDLVNDVVKMGSLSGEAIAKLAQVFLGDLALPSLTRSLLDHSGGNPLFAKEILHYWQEQGALRQTGGYWLGPVRDVSIPGSLHHIVGARIRGLSQDAFELLALLTLLNRPAPFDEIQVLSNRRLTLVSEIAEMLDRGLLRQERRALSVAHPTFGTYVLEQLAPVQKAAMHQQIFQYLVGVDSRVGSPGEIAHHALESLIQPPNMAHLLRAAATAAEEASDYEAAVAWYERLLEMLQRETSLDPQHIAKRYAAACLRVDAGRAKDIYGKYLKLYPADPDLWLGLGRAQRRLGNLEAAFAAIRQAIQLEDSAEARYHLATLNGIAGDLEQASEMLNALLPQAPEQPKPGYVCSVSSVLVNLGMAAYLGGDLPGATLLTRQAIERAPPGETAQQLQNLAWFLAVAGKWDESARVIGEALQTAKNEGDAFALGHLLAISAKLHAWKGETAAALDAALEALRLARAMRYRATEIDSHLAIAIVEYEMGLMGEAFASLRVVRDLAATTTEVYERALFNSLLVETAALEGELDEARSSFLEVEGGLDHPIWGPAAMRSAILLNLAQGNAQAAYLQVDSLQLQNVPPYEVAKLALVAQHVCERQGQEAEASRWRAHATELLTGLCRGTPKSLVAALTTKLPIGRGRPRHINPAGLTDREVEVAKLASKGLTDREIADRLTLSVRTVSKHIGSILAKTGYRRTQLSRFIDRYLV